MLDPDHYCPSCSHAWGVTEEICSYCGFDPVTNEQDEALYEQAKALWADMQKARQPD